MKAMWLAAVAVLGACGDDDPVAPDAAPDATSSIDAPSSSIDAPAGACPTAEIKFTQATGCGNDGSVEWCIPNGNAQLITQLQAIEPTISCAGGGGRAMCNATPGLLLCFYRTGFPEQCATDHGAMTEATWQDMCAIASFSEVTEIVHTIFE